MTPGKVSVKSYNVELALSTLMLQRKQERGKKGADREEERETERKQEKATGKKNKSKKDYKQTFHLGKPSFNQLLAALSR